MRFINLMMAMLLSLSLMSCGGTAFSPHALGEAAEDIVGSVKATLTDALAWLENTDPAGFINDIWSDLESETQNMLEALGFDRYSWDNMEVDQRRLTLSVVEETQQPIRTVGR